MVELSQVSDKDDEKELQQLISNHYDYTRSELAERILVNWDEYLPQFVKVIPFEYKKIQQEAKLEAIRSKIKQTEDEPHFQY
jgi:glutamate synthase (NADPH/NADH) large chain